MNKPTLLAVVSICAGIAGAAYAQGRSAPDWTTQGADAQRSSWIAVDPWISRESVPKLQFLWKFKVDNQARHDHALTAPVSLANLNTFRGFKSLVLVGGSENNLYAIDYDFGTMYWKVHFNYSSGVPEFAGSPACPGGLTSGVTRATSLTAPNQLALMGFARPPRPMKSEIGEPGRGAPQRVQPPPPNSGRAAGPTDAAARGGQAGRGRGAPTAIFSIAGDGIVRASNPINGDPAAPGAKFVPPSSTTSGLIFADDFLYTITSNGCGGAPDAIWAMDWSKDEKPVVSWKSDDAPIAGPAFAADGTLYVTTGDGTSAYANAVVALDPKTLKVKDWFAQPGARFRSSPVVFTDENRTNVAAAGEDGRIYVLDAAALGGADHKSALAATPATAKSGFGGLATWRDARGTRWLLTAPDRSAATGVISAFRLPTRNGNPAIEQGWASRSFAAPRTPIVINGVVFALASGNQTTPAVLYALDPDTGKDIWSSGKTITSFATAGLAAGTGQVYVVTYDNTVWSFGIPIPY